MSAWNGGSLTFSETITPVERTHRPGCEGNPSACRSSRRSIDRGGGVGKVFFELAVPNDEIV
jgi:hypothetical protein